MKKVAILQSNYIPWKGYFDLIAAVDEFILYDDMQYTRRDWRNRNLIKTPQGLKWLTVPVKVKGKFDQPINRTEIDGFDWISDHWKTIKGCYTKAPWFDLLEECIGPVYRQREHTMLSALNHELIVRICGFLGITTKISFSSDYTLLDGKTERLVDLCLQAGATEYISGPAAKCYVDEPLFQISGIALTWFDYSGYPEYPQLWGPFEHGVSIIDLIANCGTSAGSFMRYIGK